MFMIVWDLYYGIKIVKNDHLFFNENIKIKTECSTYSVPPSFTLLPASDTDVCVTSEIAVTSETATA